MKQGGADTEESMDKLSMYLGKDGELKGEMEAEKLLNFLKQSASEPVAQCMLLNIIRATSKQAVLSKFLAAGGWGMLHKWLVKYSDGSDTALLHELLQVYHILPVNTDLLKSNKAAKLIKSLCRSSDERIKLVAEETVSRWMRVVREQSKGSSKESSKPNKKGKDTTEDVASSGNADTPGSKMANDTTYGMAEEVSNLTIGVATAKETKERAKTVKLVNSKFRSTGLEETVVKPASKKNMPGSQLKPPAALAGIKRPVPASLETGTGTEKKAKQVATLTESEASRSRMLPPKPKNVFESTGFMDSLMLPSVPVARKKRKPSISSQNQSKQEAVSPSSPLAVNTPSALPASPIISAPPSFYRDTLESPTTGLATAPFEEMATDEERGTAPQLLSASQQSPVRDDTPSETTSVASESSQTGVTSGSKKKKKQVTWAGDSSLKEVFYFELDETERVNVNRLKASGLSSFDEMKKMEIRLDREIFKHGHVIGHSGAREAIITKMEWFSPPPIDDLEPPRVMPGERSTEKLVQENRESQSLQALYFQKEKIPASAEEVDPRSNEILEPSLRTTPVTIPLVTEEASGSSRIEPMVIDSAVLGQSILNVTLPENLIAMLAAARATPNAGPPAAINIDQRVLNALTVTSGGLPQLMQPLSSEGIYGDATNADILDHGDLSLPLLIPAGGALLPQQQQQQHLTLDSGSILQNGPAFGHFTQPRMEGGGNMPLLPSPPLQPDFEPLARPPGPGTRVPLLQAPPLHMMSHNQIPPRVPGPSLRGHASGGFRGQHHSFNGSPPVCRHFVGRGGCRFGNNCQFFHPGAHN